MKSVNLVIMFTCFLLASISNGQVLDTLVYDAFNLRGKNDRTPEFYECNYSDKKIFSNVSIDFCLRQSLKNINDDAIYPIKRITKINEFYLKMRNGLKPDERYSSIFKIALDQSGHVFYIETLSHCLSSISEDDLKMILKATNWKPALKNLIPVASKFILEIVYDNNLCHQETWDEKRAELYRRFPEYRKELMSTYINKGLMWDMEILTPMMKFENENLLSQTFDEVEKSCQIYVDSLNTKFIELRDGLINTHCQNTIKIVHKWNDDFYYFMDRTLKEKLTHNKR